MGEGEREGEGDCAQPLVLPLGPYSIRACPCFPDGKPVEVDPHHILIEDPDGSCTLILDNLTGVDSGQYMCFAASAAGNASTLGKILVQGKQVSWCGGHPTSPLSVVWTLPRIQAVGGWCVG